MADKILTLEEVSIIGENLDIICKLMDGKVKLLHMKNDPEIICGFVITTKEVMEGKVEVEEEPGYWELGTKRTIN